MPPMATAVMSLVLRRIGRRHFFFCFFSVLSVTSVANALNSVLHTVRKARIFAISTLSFVSS